MAGTQDIQEKVRGPRVHLTYEVNKDGAKEVIDLPFVLGILADLSGDRTTDEKGELGKRKFLPFEADTIDQLMKHPQVRPVLEFTVDNKLPTRVASASAIPVKLEFNSMEDFNPESIARQVEPLRKLLEVRTKLSQLLTRVEGRDRVLNLLEQVINQMGHAEPSIDGEKKGG